MHFSKMSNRSQAKLITIYDNCGVFICRLPPVSMRYMLSICNFMFRKRVLQNILSQFLTSYSLWYPIVKRFHKVPYLAFWTYFFQKYNRKIVGNSSTSMTSCVYRDFISCDIIVDFWYCLGCCVFY